MSLVKFKKAIAFALVGVVALIGIACADSSNEALKIGYLGDYSGGLSTLGPEVVKGVEVAVAQINEAGGVNGQDVSFVIGDSQLDTTVASTEATRLIEVEGVHAIIGPLASSTTLAVSEGVIADARIPQVSPSASSPGITNADDNGFTFRSALSDAAQGFILATELVPENANVGVIYVNNAYGQGLEGVFAQHFGGTIPSASYEEDATSFVTELNTIANGGADSLVIIGYNESTGIFRDAEQAGIFDTYYFVDGNRQAPFDEATYTALEGLRGTAPSGPPDGTSSPARDAFAAAYAETYGADAEISVFTREAYDATIAIALAAASADSLDGTAIRDELVDVGNAPGLTVTGGNVASLRAGLEAAANGDDVNYEGVASSLAWNAAGDIPTGFVGVWEFQNGIPATNEVFPVDLGN